VSDERGHPCAELGLVPRDRNDLRAELNTHIDPAERRPRGVDVDAIMLRFVLDEVTRKLYAFLYLLLLIHKSM
jgi:hypothetical protein